MGLKHLFIYDTKKIGVKDLLRFLIILFFGFFSILIFSPFFVVGFASLLIVLLWIPASNLWLKSKFKMSFTTPLKIALSLILIISFSALAGLPYYEVEKEQAQQQTDFQQKLQGFQTELNDCKNYSSQVLLEYGEKIKATTTQQPVAFPEAITVTTQWAYVPSGQLTAKDNLIFRLKNIM